MDFELQGKKILEVLLGEEGLNLWNKTFLPLSIHYSCFIGLKFCLKIPIFSQNHQRSWWLD